MHARRAEQTDLPARLRNVLCLNDFANVAKRRLPGAMYAYVHGWSEDGATHRRNLYGFETRAFVPRVLVDIERRDTRTTLFGVEYAAPFGIAPMGCSRLAAAHADELLAREAATAGLPFILSGASLTPLETVRAAGSTSWFQAYIPGDFARIDPMLERVALAGYDTLVVNVDTAVHPQHEYADKRGFRSPFRPSAQLAWQALTRLPWCWRVLGESVLTRHPLRFENMDAIGGPPVFSRTLVRDIGRRGALSWAHIERIRQRWPGRLVLKGVMSADDALLAQRAGIDGIIVSNHGGRQVDCALGALDALDAIAARVDRDRLALIYDGGIRRGSDVLKALHGGAHFVLVGRPLLMAAAAADAIGIAYALSLLQREIGTNMGLLGINRIDEVAQLELRRD
ncbi:FMN-dependent dehydrogenase family protein [Paraburkholderia xenovorans LB400]|uniref:L-lactate dehydrogenase n=1 Tax=Paraburkholderia xenovorans (strain LB400) TaxID=266265 RepID=Q13ZE7_PARXL|nr:alpha-hydroxy acid oxidase [Paraburkholderia xenovorans]ABE30542.1 Putative L-lactate dehydrogenase [Paraburkholderia xenovorans LB400]AIP31661.1 FMN-dependent dehydrogenase family protein [Paraburkholderia xenovorans LB400]